MPRAGRTIIRALARPRDWLPASITRRSGATLALLCSGKSPGAAFAAPGKSKGLRARVVAVACPHPGRRILLRMRESCVALSSPISFARGNRGPKVERFDALFAPASVLPVITDSTAESRTRVGSSQRAICTLPRRLCSRHSPPSATGERGCRGRRLLLTSHPPELLRRRRLACSLVAANGFEFRSRPDLRRAEWSNPRTRLARSSFRGARS